MDQREAAAMEHTSTTGAAPRTLKELLLKAPADGDHPAIFLPELNNLTVTFAQLRHSVATLQVALINASVVPGDVISVALPSGLQDLVAILAITWARATAAPFNPEFKKEEFEFYMSDVKPKAIIVPRGSTTHPARVAAEGLNIPVWEVTFNNDDLTFSLSITKEERVLTFPLEKVEGEAEVHPLPEDVAIALHTSGTTSRPKLVPLSHANVTASILHIMNWYKLTPNDRSLIVMPLFHVHGLFGAALSSIAAGGAVVVPVRFSATAFWKLVTEYKVTWYSAVPTIHQILLILADKELEEKRKQDATAELHFPNLRFIRSCSSPLAPTVFEKLERVFNAPVLEAYGMTEASHQMASNPLPEYGPRKPGSVGKGTDVVIAILDDKGHPLPQGEKGEVCIKGDNVCHGYFNNPAANKANWTEDGWFRTGDQGYLDPDGYLFLTGRIKELINRGGEKISPPEVDEVLLEHPKVSAAVTFAMPDEKYGEEVHAAVVVQGEDLAASSAEAIEASVIEFAKTKLSAFKAPKKVHVYGDAFPFPTTATGKIPRISVSNYYKEGHK